MKKKRESRGILWRILFFPAALVFLAVLELGKHTLLGWGLGLVLLIAFYLCRVRVLKKKGRRSTSTGTSRRIPGSIPRRTGPSAGVWSDTS